MYQSEISNILEASINEMIWQILRDNQNKFNQTFYNTKQRPDAKDFVKNIRITIMGNFGLIREFLLKQDKGVKDMETFEVICSMLKIADPKIKLELQYAKTDSWFKGLLAVEGSIKKKLIGYEKYFESVPLSDVANYIAKEEEMKKQLLDELYIKYGISLQFDTNKRSMK
jgi:hypothetical protein